MGTDQKAKALREEVALERVLKDEPEFAGRKRKAAYMFQSVTWCVEGFLFPAGLGFKQERLAAD